ncbi:hypothetical protein ACQ86N_40395 [Puia sp. P3]|uniref:hypothetical protein n=1 Tax=Puia sp. P3 TaxID=3423952 RepID=UPI003D667F2B
MINLTGEDPALLRGQAARISAYFTDQGFPAPATGLPLTSDIFRTQDECTAHYEKLLRSEGFFNEIVYFYSPRGEAFAPLIDSLKLQEAAFGSSEPRLYSVVKKNQLYERTVHLLENKLLATENELANQKQYAEILRSGHQSREIQDYYNREYEALPLWFKRLGHLVKVLAGKRTFRSLFRDDVKKHKD